jgi:response regulator of citrate/malate metabolism
MNTMLLSQDPKLINTITSAKVIIADKFILQNESKNPLDIMSAVCSKNPTLLIVDDDFLKPESVHILRSIKKVKNNIYVIFITSDSSFDLGREVSQLGIQFYTLKPLGRKDFRDSVLSISQLKAKQNHYGLI